MLQFADFDDGFVRRGGISIYPFGLFSVNLLKHHQGEALHGWRVGQKPNSEIDRLVGAIGFNPHLRAYNIGGRSSGRIMLKNTP